MQKLWEWNFRQQNLEIYGGGGIFQSVTKWRQYEPFIQTVTLSLRVTWDLPFLLSIFLKFKLTGYLNSSLFVNRQQLGCLVYFLVRYAFFLVLDHSSFTVEKRASFHHYSCLKQRFLSTLCASISIGMKHTFRWPIYNHLTKQPKSHCWSKKRNVRRPFLRCSAAAAPLLMGSKETFWKCFTLQLPSKQQQANLSILCYLLQDTH